LCEREYGYKNKANSSRNAETGEIQSPNRSAARGPCL